MLAQVSGDEDYLCRSGLSRFYVKTETESSVRNVVFWNINREMDNVQKHNICTTYTAVWFMLVEVEALVQFQRAFLTANSILHCSRPSTGASQWIWGQSVYEIQCAKLVKSPWLVALGTSENFARQECRARTYAIAFLRASTSTCQSVMP
jgi:hypothetical protein